VVDAKGKLIASMMNGRPVVSFSAA